MSALLSSIACALLGLAVGAALQRWGDGEPKLHGHKGPMVRKPTPDELESARESDWYKGYSFGRLPNPREQNWRSNLVDQGESSEYHRLMAHNWVGW